MSVHPVPSPTPENSTRIEEFSGALVQPQLATMESIAIDGLGVESEDLMCKIQYICQQNNSAREVGLFAVNFDRTMASTLNDLLSSRSWNRIGICRCTGRCSELVLSYALRNSKCVHVTDCPFSDRVFATLGHELSDSQTRTLAIVEMRVSKDAAQAIGGGMSLNSTLESLDLRNTTWGLYAADFLAQGLAEASKLRIVNLRFCKLRDPQLEAVLRSLVGHPSLEELYLRGNYCRAGGMQQIELLLTHPSCRLVTLDVSRQRHSSEAFDMSGLARALAHNTSLKFLDTMSNQLTDEDMMILASALRDNSSLEHLILNGANPFGCIGSQELLRTMGRNTSIQRIRLPCHGRKEERIQKKLTFLANWNRAGRRLMQEPQNQVPRALWSLVFGRVNKIEWESGRRWLRPNMISAATGEAERASIMYAILKEVPFLFE